MSKLHQYDFYYGAILNAILSKNPDACPTLLEIGEKRSVYKITTNSSEKDIIIFCKYAMIKDNKSDKYKSWTFGLSDTEKECIAKYHDNNYPVLIFFLCMEQNLYYSEIAICTYDELENVIYKKCITIGKEKNKKNFLLFRDTKERKNAKQIKSNRVEMNLNDIFADNISKLKDIAKTEMSDLIQKTEINNKKIAVHKRYGCLRLGQEIKYVSINERNENICPLHNLKMDPVYVHFNKAPDIVFYCKKCGRVYVTQEHLLSINRMIKNPNYQLEVDD